MEELRKRVDDWLDDGGSWHPSHEALDERNANRANNPVDQAIRTLRTQAEIEAFITGYCEKERKSGVGNILFSLVNYEDDSETTTRWREALIHLGLVK